MEIVRQLADAIMPDCCLLCGSTAVPTRSLCQGCLDDLPVITEACPSCGVIQHLQELCGRCRRKPPPYDRALAALQYDYPVDRLIHAYKYRQSLAVCRALAPLLVDIIDRCGEPRPQVLLPVPLHKRRLLQRGFNQSLEIARRIHEKLDIPIDTRLLRRDRATPEQARLNLAERRRNLRGAFSLARANPYRSVAIVDDVITTGSTAAELARLLRRSGTKEIRIWALARTNYQ